MAPTVRHASVTAAAAVAWSRSSPQDTLSSCMLEWWDCGVEAAEDDVVTMPSSSRESRGNDVGSVGGVTHTG